MKIGEWINIAIALITGIGLYLTARQIHRGVRQRANDNVSNLIQKLFNDPIISKAYYKIEYDEFKYDPSTFHRTDLEKEIDSLISEFDRIAREYERKLIKLSDLEPISYKYLRVWENEEINKYLNFLHNQWQDFSGYKQHSFSSFIKVGKELFDKYKKN
jgi:DNA-binding Lrp family transcriptional regulator